MAEYTQDSFAALEAALAKAVAKHQEAQRQIGIVTAGDANVWHDNFAFDEANREEQRWRIEVAKLKSLVAEATVVEKEGEYSRVQVGAHVKVLIDDEEETFVIAGEQNLSRRSDNGVMWLSQSAPLGAALMGHAAGEAISYILPKGSQQEALIVAVW